MGVDREATGSLSYMKGMESYYSGDVGLGGVLLA